MTGVAATTASLLLFAAVPASAAPVLSVANLTATVVGTTASVSATVTSSSSTDVDLAGVCVRNASGENVDLPSAAARISSRGTTLNLSGVFAPGSYTYWGCVYTGGSWVDLGSPKTFVVGGAVTSALAAASSSNGSTMPVGNLPGWTQTFKEDFNTPVSQGSFPGPYSNQWMSYDGFSDAFHTGFFEQDIISAQNGNLDVYLHTQNGRALGAAPIPLINGKWGGQTYGKFSVRMRSDELEGFGTGFLLWPDSGNWNDGEIDFPESSLTEGVKGYNHCLNSPSSNCMIAETNYRYNDWHTYSIEWTPSRLSFLVDDTVVGTTTNNIPSKPLHWVMQIATHGSPAASTAGHMQIDWVSIYNYAG